MSTCGLTIAEEEEEEEEDETRQIRSSASHGGSRTHEGRTLKHTLSVTLVFQYIHR